MNLRTRLRAGALTRGLRLAVFGLVIMSAAHPARAQIRSVEFQLDNDQFAFTPGSKERWYTSGIFVRAALDPQPDAPDARVMAAWCRSLIDCDPNAQMQRIWSVSQVIYTPAYTGTTLPQPKDWPYAAALSAGLKVMAQGSRTRQSLGLQLGVIGPAALGEPVQNAVHRLVGQPLALGFDLQVKTQPLIQADWSRLVAIPLAGRTDLDLVTRTAVLLGNPVTQAGIGAQFRFGVLPAGPGWPGEFMPASAATRGLYGFIGAQAQAVARNQLIDGETAGYESLVKSRHAVGELFAGGSWCFTPGWWFDFTFAMRSLEFTAPPGARSMTPQRYGMLTLRWASD